MERWAPWFLGASIVGALVIIGVQGTRGFQKGYRVQQARYAR